MNYFRHMSLKTVLPVAAVCFIAGWLLASLLAPPVAELQGLPQRAQAKPASTDAQVTVPYTEQLHLKLQQHTSTPPVPRRNPFVFGERPRTAAPPAPAPHADAPDEAPPPMPPIVTGPSFTLSGIGESETAEGIVRTAIISDGQTVHLAKVGDVVNGYAVVEITENSVIVGNAADARWMLRLR